MTKTCKVLQQPVGHTEPAYNTIARPIKSYLVSGRHKQHCTSCSVISSLGYGAGAGVAKGNQGQAKGEDQNNNASVVLCKCLYDDRTGQG